MFWINSGLLLLLVAGHVELLIALVNRVHSLRMSRRYLRHFRRLHNVLIPLFPAVLFYYVGIHDTGLLDNGNWSDLSLGWMVYLSFCAMGFMSLVITSVWQHVRSTPRAEISNDSRTVDVAKRLGYRPLAKGPHHYLAGLPGNEIFRIQVSEKLYRMPRLPDNWDGLSILHLSDLHFIGTVDLAFFEQVVEISQDLDPDLIVFTGDLLDNLRLLEWLPQTLGRLKAPLGCYYTLGNHDWDLNPAEIRRQMDSLGWKNVASQNMIVEHKGRSLSIAGTELPWMGRPPDYSQVPLGAFRVLLSHTPDNLRWAKQQEVDLMLSGHNHGGQIRLPLVGPVYSPSWFGCRYASGVFWDNPTLLYVSRGISSKQPIRWRCPPELTKLVLKAPVPPTEV